MDLWSEIDNDNPAVIHYYDPLRGCVSCGRPSPPAESITVFQETATCLQCLRTAKRHRQLWSLLRTSPFDLLQTIPTLAPGELCIDSAASAFVSFRFSGLGHSLDPR